MQQRLLWEHVHNILIKSGCRCVLPMAVQQAAYERVVKQQHCHILAPVKTNRSSSRHGRPHQRLLGGGARCGRGRCRIVQQAEQIERRGCRGRLAGWRGRRVEAAEEIIHERVSGRGRGSARCGIFVIVQAQQVLHHIAVCGRLESGTHASGEQSQEDSSYGLVPKSCQ